MKGTEVDNRRRFRQLSPQASEERRLAELISQGKLERTSRGQLRVRPEHGASPQTQELVYQLPAETWE